jgi:hypothetical protein
MIVMNRLSTTNLEQNITSQFQLEVIDPYLIFRCADHTTGIKTIYGIWFYDPEERTSSSELLKR